MESKRNQITRLQRENPIWKVLEDDANDLRLKRKQDGYLCLTANDLLKNDIWIYMLDCYSLATNNIEFKTIYETWDLIELYNTLMIKYVNNYQEPPPEVRNAYSKSIRHRGLKRKAR